MIVFTHKPNDLKKKPTTIVTYALSLFLFMRIILLWSDYVAIQSTSSTIDPNKL